MLESFLYLVLLCELSVWHGFSSQELIRGPSRPKAHIIRVIEGFETVMFRSKFDVWPQTAEVGISDDARGKVAG